MSEIIDLDNTSESSISTEPEKDEYLQVQLSSKICPGTIIHYVPIRPDDNAYDHTYHIQSLERYKRMQDRNIPGLVLHDVILKYVQDPYVKRYIESINGDIGDLRTLGDPENVVISYKSPFQEISGQAIRDITKSK